MTIAASFAGHTGGRGSRHQYGTQSEAAAQYYSRHLKFLRIWWTQLSGLFCAIQGVGFNVQHTTEVPERRSVACDSFCFEGNDQTASIMEFKIS